MERSPRLFWLSWISMGIGLILLFALGLFSNNYETVELRSMPLTWILLSGAGLCFAIGGYAYYHVEWSHRMGNFGSPIFLVLFLVMGVVLAFILTAAWQALR